MIRTSYHISIQMGTVPRYWRKRLVVALPLWWQSNAENEWGLHPNAEWSDLRKGIITFIHRWGVHGVAELATSSVRFEIRGDRLEIDGTFATVVKKFGQYSGEVLPYYLERFADHKPVGDFRIYGVKSYPGMTLCSDMDGTWLESEGGASLPFVIKAMDDLLWISGDKYE